MRSATPTTDRATACWTFTKSFTRNPTVTNGRLDLPRHIRQAAGVRPLGLGHLLTIPKACGKATRPPLTTNTDSPTSATRRGHCTYSFAPKNTHNTLESRPAGYSDPARSRLSRPMHQTAFLSISTAFYLLGSGIERASAQSGSGLPFTRSSYPSLWIFDIF